MKLLKVLLISSILAQSLVLVKSIPCALEWQAGSLGSVPDRAIESGPGEYTARVFVGEWIATKLSSRKQKVSVVVQGQEIFRENYDVLTNPNNCIVEWVKSDKTGFPNFPPDGYVPTTLGADTYVGRGKVDGYTIGGTVHSGKGLAVTHQGGEQFLRVFDILVSIYPKLHGSLQITGFDKTDRTDAYNKALQELIGSSLIEISTGGSKDDLEEIKHAKTLNERFILEEDMGWVGLSSLDVSFALWFGTSDVRQLVQIQGKQIKIERPRNIEFSKTITIANNRNIQVCTVILKPEETAEIGFDGIAELRADGMNVEQLKEIMDSLGRKIVDTFPESNSVTTDIKGRLKGRFALDLSSYEFILDKSGNKAGKCLDLHDEPRT